MRSTRPTWLPQAAPQRQLAMTAAPTRPTKRTPVAGAKASNRGSPKRRPNTIEAALSYLEKASPAALATHRVRLVALAGRATAAPGAPTQPPVEQDQPPVASAVAAVLDCDSLFFQILNFCDAVGARRHYFSQIIGDRESRPRPVFPHGAGGRYLHDAARPATVNRRWREFTSGETGRVYLATEERAARERSARGWRSLTTDASATAFHRLQAAAAADDVAILRSAPLLEEASREFAAYDRAQDSEASDEDATRTNEGVRCLDAAHRSIHRGALMELFTQWMLHRGYDEDKESAWGREEVLALCLLNAASQGAENAVAYLATREPPAPALFYFNPDNGTCTLGMLLGRASDYSVPALRGLDAMDRHLRSTDKWWTRELVDLVEQRVRGSNGSHLHIAAARGNRGLVEFLLHAGVPAELPMYDDLDGPHSRDPYSRGPPRPGRSYTPADWARNRGEVEVAELLETYEHPERPRLFTGETYARGTLVRFNVEKGFGFIEPEQDEDEDDLPDVFVHCSTLYAACAPWCSDRRSFFPEPGQQLAYVVGKGKGGRPRAVRVANKRALSYIEAGHDVGGVYWDRATAICRWGEYVHMCRSYQEDSPDYYY